MTKSQPIVRNPKPAVERIVEIASRVRQGDILLPKFQREFVWSKKQITELLDSIYRNYPIGSILLWLSREKLQSESSIADLSISSRSEEYPINYLLDGQQRIGSICGVLYWGGGDAGSNWNVVFDLRSESFLHLDTNDSPPVHQVRLNLIPEASRYFQHIASLAAISGDDAEIIEERAKKLFDRFIDYSIATVTLEDMPIEDVAPIFERINSTGTRLTIVDLMRAATWSEDFDLIDAIDEQVLSAVEPKGFDSVERKAVLRNLAAASTGGFSADSIDNLRQKSATELKSASESVIKAYKLSVDFLAEDLGVPSEKIIPYQNQIVVLSEVFRRLPSPSAQQRAALARWFWRSTLSGYFSGWNTGQMTADLAAVVSFSEGRSDELEANFVRPSEGIWVARQFRSNNAHAKMLGLMLASRGPRDFLSGQQISLSSALAWENSKEYHHFFPQAYLKSLKEKPARINCVANFILLSSASNKAISDQRPSEYVRQCEDRLGAEFTNIAAANLLSSSAIEAAKEDRFSDFLIERSATLDEYAKRLCGW